jgi:hypothetical protein
MRRRLVLGLLLGVVCSLLGAASASACAIANLRLDPSAGPGDTVSYSISGIEPSATYSFTIAGLTVSGTNTNSYPGVSGTFTMPDLGSEEQTLTADGECSCPDGSESPGLIAHMQYLPPPPVATSEPAAPAQQADPSSGSHSRRPALPVALGKHVAEHQRHDGSSVSTAAGTSPADSVGSGPSPRQPSSGSDSAERPSGESSSVPHEVVRALGSTTSVGPAKVPTMGLLLMAIIFIAGTALAAFLIYLSQTGPDPQAALKSPAPLPEDPVEAELQEMIADEMASKLLADLELGEAVSPPAE